MALTRTTMNDRIMIVVIILIQLLLSLIALYYIEWAVSIFSITLALLIILFVLFDLYRRTSITEDERLAIIKDEVKSQTHQVEALLSIHAFIKPVLPLPRTMGFAASPDFLSLVIETILKNKPELIIEAGSGVSTLVSAYCFKKIGKGKIISLDHEKEYADKTRDMIIAHGLQDFVEIVHAPLVDIEIHGEKWKWYDISKINIEDSIDMLMIDGPPRKTQSLARYPALPLLYDKFNEKFNILLDDAQRKDEQKAVARWKDEYPKMLFNYLELQKGAFAIRDGRE